MTTPLNKMEQLESTLQALFRHIQWTADPESIRLIDEALKQLTELQEQEKLLAEIF